MLLLEVRRNLWESRTVDKALYELMQEIGFIKLYFTVKNARVSSIK
jgi:hypothetical protein